MSELYKAEVVLKGKDVPDFGLGKGVISSQLIDFSKVSSLATKAAAMIGTEKKMVESVVEVRWKEIDDDEV